MTKHHILSVIIPTQGQFIAAGHAISRVQAVKLPEGLTLELIVADDSPDAGSAMARSINDQAVNVISHHSTPGVGAAVRAGFEAAHGDIIVLQDLDMEFDPINIPALVQPILDEQADVVVGSRFQATHPVMSFWESLKDRGVSAVIRLLFNTNLSDITSESRAISAWINPSTLVESSGSAYSTELTAKLLRSGVRFFEVPVSYSSQRKQVGRPGRVAMLATFVRFRIRPAKTRPRPGHSPGGTIIDITQGSQRVRR